MFTFVSLTQLLRPGCVVCGKVMQQSAIPRNIPYLAIRNFVPVDGLHFGSRFGCGLLWQGNLLGFVCNRLPASGRAPTWRRRRGRGRWTPAGRWRRRRRWWRGRGRRWRRRGRRRRRCLGSIHCVRFDLNHRGFSGVDRLEPVQALVVAGCLEQLVGVLLGVEQGGPVHQRLSSVPHGVRDGLLGVDPEQVL